MAAPQNHEQDTPVPVQIALQGGGAKLVYLVAVMEVVQKLQEDKKIRVTRIAGTSAGALIGCLFAAGVSMRVLKERLKHLTPPQLAKLFPIHRMALRKLIWGQPMWSDVALRSELKKWFGQQKVEKFKDIKEIEVLVTSANLTTSAKKPYGKEDDIVEAILDSCAIPYFFRAWKSAGNSVIVDGGICENFPAEALLDAPNNGFGDVLGVSFSPEHSNRPNTAMGFTMALLETAMNNAIDRAKRRLGENRVLIIDPKINTFDFTKAVEILKESNGGYENTQKNTQEFFAEYLNRLSIPDKGEVQQTIWDTVNVEVMENLYLIYKEQHEMSKIIYQLGQIVVRANSLANPSDSDEINYFFRFTTGPAPMLCHGVTLNKANHNLVSRAGNAEATLTYEGVNGNEQIKVIILPMQKGQSTKERHLLLNFIPPLPPNTGPYALRYKERVNNFMAPLLAKGQDFLSINPLRAKGFIERMEIVLIIPNELGTVNPSVDNYNYTSNSRPMTAVELGGFDLFTPAEFHPIGWCVKHAPPDIETKVYFNRIVESK